LKKLDVWFASGAEVVAWFRRRREIGFERIQSADGTSRFRLSGSGRRIHPPLKIRIQKKDTGDVDAARTNKMAVTDLAWDGDTEIELGPERPAMRESEIGVLAISTCE
jgi:hypothetical protein